MTDQTSGSAQSADYIELAADIVSAFVSNNSVPAADLPALIASVHGALQNVGVLQKRQKRPVRNRLFR
jgi:predicted transcriptional regulator